QHSLLSPLDCLSAKADEGAGGGAYASFILTARWLGWLCYLLNIFCLHFINFYFFIFRGFKIP
ncbi:MAG: hypothetical protein U0N53_04620, partial [Ruthenibacterium sp.]|nr:hypothetical protein [Ruthenibacterium sp.]